MSDFAFINGKSQTETESDQDIFREYAWDFEHDCFIYRGGKLTIVEGKEALKVWIYKTLKTERYRYLAYERNCGAELEQFIGRAPNDAETAMEVERYVREALLVNPHIKDLKNIDFTNEKDVLEMRVTVESEYGEVTMHVNV